MESRIAANYNDATQLGRVARGQYGAHGRLHIVALEILPFLCLKCGKLPAGLAGTIQAQMVDEGRQKPQRIEQKLLLCCSDVLTVEKGGA